MDFDPGYWLNLGRQAGVIVGIGLVFALPVGYLIWRKTGSRVLTFWVGLAAALSGLLVVAFIYYSAVLCPPGAGCV